MKIITLYKPVELMRGDELFAHRYSATFIMANTIQHCSIILTLDQEQPSEDVVLCDDLEHALTVTQKVIDDSKLVTTVQIGHYEDAGEEITEVVAVREMTQGEYEIQETLIDVYDDGGSHVLAIVTDKVIAELKERGATNMHKLEGLK